MHDGVHDNKGVVKVKMDKTIDGNLNIDKQLNFLFSIQVLQECQMT